MLRPNTCVCKASAEKRRGGRRGKRRFSPTDLLKYRAQRPLCLTIFGIVHLATVAAGVTSSVSQTFDIVHLLRSDAVAKTNFIGVWGLLQNLALRLYGVVFAMGVVIAELSE